MCRLFGLIANKDVDVEFSMLEAYHKFKNQGKSNPDGWGIGWFESGTFKVEKSPQSAFESENFDKLVKTIKSKIFIVHVRRASYGKISKENSHPFIFKKWIFAHNGTVNKSFIESLLVSPYNENFTSEPIDSEVYFRYIIQCIDSEKDVLAGIKKALKDVLKRECFGANFLLSDGENLWGFRYGYKLCWLYRDPKEPFYEKSKETYLLIRSKELANEKAVLIASEEITKDEEWQPVSDGEIVFVDKFLNVKVEKIL